MNQLTAAESRALNVEPARWEWMKRGAIVRSAGSAWPDPSPEQVIQHYFRAAGVGSGPKKGGAARPSLGRRWLVAALLTVVVVAATGLQSIVRASLQHGRPDAVGITGCLVVLALAIVGLYAARDRKQVTVAAVAEVSQEAPLEAPRFPLPNMKFGTPGGIGAEASTFGAAEVAAGVRGEAATAKLLELLMEIPGVNVFHGLRFPGSTSADVDHAVVHGDIVYLIDSKQYRPGVYSWGSGREIVNGSAGSGFANHMAAAREGYWHILEGKARVHALVIVHGRGATIGPRAVQDEVRLTSAQWALAFIGDSLLAQHRSGWSEYDNSRIMGRLLSNLK